MDYFLSRKEKRVDYRNPKIKNVELRISEKCNLRCPMCWWWGENGVGFKDVATDSSRIYNELSKFDYYAVIDQLKDHQASVTVIGGEPFVRKDAIDIVEYACKNLPSASIITNGTLLDQDTIRKLSKIENLEITFSIDGPENIHDKIRGSGNFKRTTSAMRELVRLKGNKEGPIVTSNTTITPNGVDGLIKTVNDLEILGIDIIKMQHLWFTNHSYAERHMDDLMMRLKIRDNGAASHIIEEPREMDLEKLADTIERIEQTKHSVPILIKPRLTKREIFLYYTNLEFLKRDRCPVAWQTIRVEPDGNVIFCPDDWISEYKLGNVKDQSINDIWFSERANRFRDTLKRALFPGCARCCVLNL